jgi:hypothetical protein
MTDISKAVRQLTIESDGTLKGSQTSAECSNLQTSPLVFTDDQCESTGSTAVVNCPRQRHSISLHPKLQEVQPRPQSNPPTK